MRRKLIVASIFAAALAAIGTAGFAQRSHEGTEGQISQDQIKPGTPGGGMMPQGMMGQGQGMAGSDMNMRMMMGRMTTHHQQMTETMNKLMQSMTAIQNEKDPAALKSKMAEHRDLLEQMQAQMMQQGGTMQGMMQNMMGGAAPASPNPPVTK